MPRFSIRNPYLIVVVSLILAVVGAMSVVRMPVDLFPAINIPEVVVATFYNGMPPEEVETEITSRFERFFTLGSGIEHIESRSLPGVSIIKIYFQPGTNSDSDVTEISNLAMANLRRLPPGTLPPVVLKFDASSLPVTLVTLEGKGLSETALRDAGQFAVRNQLATVAGASVPPPFGGKYRQIMVYTNPLKLLAYNLSPMDVVRAVNNSNLILPAGDAKIGPYDYNIYTNSQLQTVQDINQVPLKTVGARTVTVGDIGQAKDGAEIQTNVVLVNGQRSVYLPILKQGSGTNTIAVVQGIRKLIGQLVDVPAQLKAKLAFDQSLFVQGAIRTVVVAAVLGLGLTCLLVLVFLGSLRATFAVFLSVPLSVLAAFLFLYFGGGSINAMVLAGVALAFSRLIYNAVVVLENIFRHLEQGEAPEEAAAAGGEEMATPVLVATLATAVVFFPVTFLYGVSRYLFTALAVAAVLALAASYFVALTLVPLLCSRWLQSRGPRAAGAARAGWGERFHARFQRGFERLLDRYEPLLRRALARPRTWVVAALGLCGLSAALYPVLGVAYFPRSDAGQFIINLKAPSGTRIEDTTTLTRQVEAIVRKVVAPSDLQTIVSNIGVTPGFSSIYTSNSGPHTATIEVGLTANHKVSSFTYMDRARREIARKLPEASTFFESGGLQDAVLNFGAPAPIDVQVSGDSEHALYATALQLAEKIKAMPGVSDTYIPQDLDYPALRLDVNREQASEMGLTQKEVVDNVITALTSNGMIAPSYWIDPKTGNDYMLTVQYPESAIQSLDTLREIPLRAGNHAKVTMLDAVSKMTRLESPTEVDHYQIQRVMDVYVAPKGEDLGGVAAAIQKLLGTTRLPPGVQVTLRGTVQSMRSAFASFGLGLALALVLLYLFLVPAFRSFQDPLAVLLAVPPGLAGVILTLAVTGATLNVMSLMGTVMLVGVAVSNSILIVEYAQRMRAQGMAAAEAAVSACRVRMRPVLLTSLATIIGLVPMTLKLGVGSEAYVPLALAIIGGLAVSFVATLYIVPAGYAWIHRHGN
ncbi:MAG TPA: efflux RND transporter permease subunit [Terriglobales bacterium]|nr:efflux RND transporter permease subunit [Terriglobales bacterium]